MESLLSTKLEGIIFLITMLIMIDLLNITMGRHAFAHIHVHIILHCECPIGCYHNAIIIPQYQLENCTDFKLFILLNFDS